MSRSSSILRDSIELTRTVAIHGVRAYARRGLPLEHGTKMANRAIWSMRKRHEWLATPLKAKRVKRATRLRSGQQDAMDRKAGVAQAEK